MTSPGPLALALSFDIPDAVVADEGLANLLADRIRPALQPELGRLDVPVSTRATPADLPADGGTPDVYGGTVQ